MKNFNRFSVANMKEAGLNGYMHNFSVDYFGIEFAKSCGMCALRARVVYVPT